MCEGGTDDASKRYISNHRQRNTIQAKTQGAHAHNMRVPCTQGLVMLVSLAQRKHPEDSGRAGGLRRRVSHTTTQTTEGTGVWKPPVHVRCLEDTPLVLTKQACEGGTDECQTIEPRRSAAGRQQPSKEAPPCGAIRAGGVDVIMYHT